jgi:hypothetical protein
MRLQPAEEIGIRLEMAQKLGKVLEEFIGEQMTRATSDTMHYKVYNALSAIAKQSSYAIVPLFYFKHDPNCPTQINIEPINDAAAWLLALYNCIKPA